ncbi:kinase-like domain-containing protein [Gongronella butleri]|nr:kinase-like domain-containing protein [Gongronella butleri]
MNAINERLANARLRKGLTTWVRGQLIGAGGFSRVFHAFNISACQWMVAKRVSKPNKLTSGDINNEIKLLSRFSHRNIVQYLGYDIDHQNLYLYIFLEYVAGGSLRFLLNIRGPCPPAIAQFLTHQITTGLVYLHENQVIHRDMKSDNILIDEQGICKITDFGLSRICTSAAYDSISMMSFGGTPNWMAPEAVRQQSCSAKLDIWGLGCVVIELMTGGRPWGDAALYEIIYKLEMGTQPPVPENCPAHASSFIKDCLAV